MAERIAGTIIACAIGVVIILVVGLAGLFVVALIQEWVENLE